MAVNATVRKIDTFHKNCILTIYDDDELIISGGIGIDLNPDGTANTAGIVQKIKDYIFDNRLRNLEYNLSKRIE